MTRYRQTMREALEQVRQQQFTEGHSDKDFEPYPDWKKTSGGMYPRFKHPQKGEINIDRYGEWIHADKSGKTVAFFRTIFPKTNTTGGTSMKLTDYLKKINEVTEAKKGFNFKGQHITDPYYDETGRFKVDPKKYYGLSDKQLKDLFKEENDHEVSMARGELEAIADKATQLASMLQSKSDEGNPLEAWVQSKITKAKDYITSVSDYLTYNPDMKQNEEVDLDEAEDYGLKGTITDKQLQNIKSVWSNKTKKDITPGVKAMLAKLDSPTRLAIKMAKINVLSDLVEEINEGFSSSLKQKAKEIAKKFANNMTKAVDEIEKLAKGLSDEPEVYKVIKQYNEDTQRPGPSNPNPKELDEAQSHTVRYTDPLNKKRFAIPYKTHADAEKKMAQLKKDGVKEIEITMDTLKPGMKFKEFKEELEEGIMKDIYTMDKEGASADDIAKRLKINVNTVKKILGEQKEELPVKKDEKKESDDKQNQIASKDKEIESLRGQVSLLKQKVENEKNKAIKPEPNPKTGEVPLTIGIAHAEFKKQDEKKKEVKEESLNEKVADNIIKDLQKAYGDLKGKTISPEMAKKISKHLDQPTYDLDTLRQLQKANIPFISTLAKNKIYKKTGKFEEKRLHIESLAALKNKAEKTGMPYNILKQVYDRGMAAWKSGHRPGAGQQQWALARVNSFVTKSSGTWGGADKDLAAKVKGEK